MSLVKMSTLVQRASEAKRGVGSFSVYSMEALMGAIRAAEELNTPIIIQLAEGRFKTAPFELMGPMMLGAANSSGIDIAVHLDHGAHLETLKRALDMGFTSVMIDGSSKPFAENVELTCKAKELADAYGADLEAELGLVGRSEDGTVDHGVCYTVPADAESFVKQTKVDLLAVAIGNQHGNYKGVPQLRLDILREIHALIPETPLVLHGGSGISDADFQECIRNGIRKVNIATAILNRMVSEAGSYIGSEEKPDYYGMNRLMAAGAKEVVAHHIRVFNMEQL